MKFKKSFFSIASVTKGGASKSMVNDRMTLREFGLEPVRSSYLMDICLVRVILMT